MVNVGCGHHAGVGPRIGGGARNRAGASSGERAVGWGWGQGAEVDVGWGQGADVGGAKTIQTITFLCFQ